MQSSETAWVFDELWHEVESHWQDPSVHQKFVTACSMAGELPEAARRYRRAGERDPSRRPEVSRQLQALAFLATQGLQTERTTPRDRKALTLVAWAFMLAMTALAAWGAWRLGR